MTEYVSEFCEVMLRGCKFILLLAKKAHDVTDIQKVLNKFSDTFGTNAKLDARLVRSHKETSEQTLYDIIHKPWPEQFEHRLRSTTSPFLLIIDTDFQLFDPQRDEWRLIWFYDLKAPRRSIERLLDAFLRSLQRNEG
ncbi:MAG: hypothetical protein QGH07_09130, partial [Alphaproteobacteria bacterium]|nr:hypothetical protein [Alphaproteobacteria bacterium]